MQEVSAQDQDVAAWLEAAVPRLVRKLAPERIPTAVGIRDTKDRNAKRRNFLQRCTVQG